MLSKANILAKGKKTYRARKFAYIIYKDYSVVNAGLEKRPRKIA